MPPSSIVLGVGILKECAATLESVEGQNPWAYSAYLVIIEKFVELQIQHVWDMSQDSLDQRIFAIRLRWYLEST